jgi:hypothetical protein
MNKLETQYWIIDDVYEKYSIISGMSTQVESLSKEEFTNKIKNDSGFAKKWGLKIEERELSLEERSKIWNETHNPVGNIYTHNQYDENDMPTKLITITYKNKTIESYE